MQRSRIYARLMKRGIGQTLTEAVMLMPIFLILAFTLLQVGHLGIAVAVVNYAASSAARQAVEQNSLNDGNAADRVKQLLSVGLTLLSAHSKLDGDTLTPNVTVIACASLPAYPFVGLFLDKALSKQVSGDSCAPGAKALGPVALKGPPYVFIIQGESTARMNYTSH